MKLTNLVARRKTSSFGIEKLVSIKDYIPIKQKFKIMDEYRELLEIHKDDYPNYEFYVAFIFFNLIVIKYYTDIDIEMTYDEFDLLSSNNILADVAEKIGQDYTLLMELAQINMVR